MEQKYQDNLDTFFDDELSHHTSNNNTNYIVSFNIGTYNSIDQELNNEWLTMVNPYLLSKQYHKIFYYIDSEYNKICMKDMIVNFCNKLQSFYGIHIKNMINFKKKNEHSLCNVIDSYHNDQYNITIHKINENLESSYNYVDIFTKAYKNKYSINRTFESIPTLNYWTRLYFLIKYFKNINNHNIIYINNYACTNTNMYINNEHNIDKPLFIKTYMGKYLEYFSELGYILKYLYRTHLDKQILFRCTPYENGKETIKPIIEFKQFTSYVNLNWEF